MSRWSDPRYTDSESVSRCEGTEELELALGHFGHGQNLALGEPEHDADELLLVVELA